MSILDGIMGSMGGGMTQMIEQQVAGAIAAKMGIDPAMAQAAIAALTQAHPQPGDTVATAAASSGLSTDMLSQITSHLGGEGGLGSLLSAVTGQSGGAGAATAGDASTAAPDGAGGIAGALTGMLGGLMGGNR
jgi:hypothetical protein